MSLRLPLQSSALRELFEVADLAEPAKLPSFALALRGAREFLAKEPAARAVNSIAIRANGQVWLFRVGKRGGWKRLWNFGNA